ncbi:MAG: hypothetical protein AAF996_13910 [Pseudomonadota bacterium]
MRPRHNDMAGIGKIGRRSVKDVQPALAARLDLSLMMSHGINCATQNEAE